MTAFTFIKNSITHVSSEETSGMHYLEYHHPCHENSLLFAAKLLSCSPSQAARELDITKFFPAITSVKQEKTVYIDLHHVMQVLKISVPPSASPLDIHNMIIYKMLTDHIFAQTTQRGFSITYDDLHRIVTHIHIHHKTVCGRIQSNDMLPRSVDSFDYEGKHYLFINFNKRKQKDKVIGVGGFKEVKFATDLFANIVARTTCPVGNIKNEIPILKKLPKERGLVNFLCENTYIGRKGQEKHALFFEYYEKGDLWQNIKNKTLTSAQKDSITMDLLCGLNTLHKLGITHRDIKEPNILLGKNYNAVITDFGSACEKEDEETKSRVLGTPNYMPPEILKKMQENNYSWKDRSYIDLMNPNMDMWAMGITLARLHWVELSDETKQAIEPIVATTIEITKMKELLPDFIINQQEIQNAGIPYDDTCVEYLIMRMLRTNPQERISAQEALKLWEKTIKNKNSSCCIL